MKKRKSIRLINAGDILLTIICLIGMAIALYLFWEDLNVSLSKQDEAPVAVVYFKKNTVQRRFVDRNLWERVQESALVYDGDRIRTSDMSEAVTVFADGTEIEIHENTLIQIYKQKDRAAIDFVSGAITATAAGFEGEETEAAPLLIKTGDKVVELDSGSAASVAAPVSSAGRAVSASAAGEKAEQKSEAVAVTVTKGTAVVREATKEDTYKEKTVAKSIVSAAQNSITDFGETARQVISNVSAVTVPAAPVEDITVEKQVIQAGEVSVVKTVEADAAITDAENKSEREATLFLPLSSTTVRLEEDILPLIRMQWTSNTELTFEFTQDASFAKSLFTRTYPAYQEQAYVSFEDYTELGSVFWRSYFAGDPESVFATGIVLFEQLPDESVQEMIDRVLNDEKQVPLKDEPDTQEEAIKAEAIRKEEEERKAREEAARLDAEKARRAEEERREAERIAEEERLEAERRAEQERLEAERRAEQERLEAERRAAEEARQKKLEEERIAAEKAAAERRLAEARAAEEKRLAEQKRLEEERAAREEQERLAREEAERQRLEEEARKAEAQRRLEEERARIEAEKAAQLEAARKAFAASSTTLRDPRDGKVLDDSFFDTNRSLLFSWTPLADASSYRLVIKQKGLLSKTIVDRSMNGTSYTMRDLSDLDEGDFEWTVTGKMSDGTESKTATGSFSVKLEPLDNIQLDMSDLFHR